MGRPDAASEPEDESSTAGEGGGRRWASLALDPSPRSVRSARAWAQELAERWEIGDLDWPLLQLVTEVVTNSVLHARTRFVVRIEQDRESGAVRCSVTDLSPVRLRKRAHSSAATTGRGLQMLERLSSAWGVETSSTGKTVWFELRPGVEREIGGDGWEELADLGTTETAAHPTVPVALRSTRPRPTSSRRLPPVTGKGLAA